MKKQRQSVAPATNKNVVLLQRSLSTESKDLKGKQKQAVCISKLSCKSLQNCKEISKKKKVEEWLKHVEHTPISQSPPKKRKESSSSTSSVKKQDNPKKKNDNSSKPTQPKAIGPKPIFMIESDSSAGESSKENKQNAQQAYKIPKKEEPQTAVRNSAYQEQSSKITVKKEENVVSSMDASKIKNQGVCIVKCKQVDLSTQVLPKKMRPASFVLKSSGVNESCQTDINSVNLKELQNCDSASLFNLKYKYTIDLKHDMFARRTSGPFYDCKGNDLTSWVEFIIDNYQLKNKCRISENSNCFITLNSRFKVFETKDFNHLELLHIIDNDNEEDAENKVCPTYKWMKDVADPIRIHVQIDKEIYKQYLGEENSSKLPEMVITRIFPSSY